MVADSLQDSLTKLIEQTLSREARPEMRLRGSPRAAVARSPGASEVAGDLARQALASRLPLLNSSIDERPLGGGNTAELVAVLTLRTPFILKLDRKDSKLAREGVFMREVRENEAYPLRFRQAWPVVYAVREEPPYAYLMEYFPHEDGWLSLEDRLYPKPGAPPVTASQAQRLIDAALDLLFTGYEARQDKRMRPSIDEDYVGRIRERLAAAAGRDPRFESRPLSVNGTPFAPWADYLGRLAASEAYLAKISPPFSTVAHGDPNPGNLMCRSGASSIELKLIDPKDWKVGDYLFDIAKLTHFLEGTGPIEKRTAGVDLEVAFRETGGTAQLSYNLNQPVWTDALVAACLDRVQQFALAHADPYWAARYELGMAANLLGLPEGRLAQGRPDAALALYGEGLRWLDRFCARLNRDGGAATPAVARAAPDEIEPPELARARTLVREQVPGVREATDPRGFPLLHWDPASPNDRGKPNELTLEHEARLSPTSDAAITALQEALSATARSGGVVGDSILPGNAAFGALTVTSYDREPGFQSIDRYWEASDSPPEMRLIGRMMSLRERMATRDFMTWAASGRQTALNFELPIVALGASGVVARLEFNWIDDIQAVIDAYRDEPGADQPTANPLALAARLHAIGKGAFEPLIEHTTFREKFAISEPAVGPGASGRQLFQFNIDHIVAQSLRTRRIASYTDVDIAPSRPVDPAMLAALIGFSEALAARYELVPLAATKVWRDANITGELT